MAKWTLPSGRDIEVGDGPGIDEHAKKNGWKRADKPKRGRPRKVASNG